jgi:hypothetical protein
MNNRWPKCAHVKSETLTVCPSDPVIPAVIPENPIVAKIPVVLSESNIQIDVEADIWLKKPAFEIKRIKKDVVLTQAKLLPFASFYNQITGEFEGGKLFLKGYILKNIEYATVEYTSDGSYHYEDGKAVCGDIVHATVRVPFHCVAEVVYNTAARPIVKYRENTKEIEIFRNCKLNCFGKCLPEYIGSDFCQYNFEDQIGYTEDFSVELEDVHITEVDFEKHFYPYYGDNDSTCHEETESSNSMSYPGLFNKIVEKIVLNIKLKVLQDQQVRVQSLGPEIL